MKSIHDIVPDPEALLSMKPEGLAGVILEHFNSNPSMQINKHNFGLRYTVQEYPEAVVGHFQCRTKDAGQCG